MIAEESWALMRPSKEMVARHENDLIRLMSAFEGLVEAERAKGEVGIDLRGFWFSFACDHRLPGQYVVHPLVPKAIFYEFAQRLADKGYQLVPGQAYMVRRLAEMTFDKTPLNVDLPPEIWACWLPQPRPV